MVKIKPVIAQNFIKLPVEFQQILIDNYVIPVNEVFLETYNNRDFEVLLVYGGYGSGKSVFVADMLIDECLNNSYFKCLYGRKVFDTIRISVFDTLCDRIEDRGLQEFFQYSRKPNSSMQILCTNNNIFLPFGGDDPGKLKSVKDPSHFFCEELDQFSQDDFAIFITRLRTEKAQTKFIGAFNTVTVYADHWIRQTFFDEAKELNYKLKKVFCNYPDNAFINQDDYVKKLWIGAGYDEKKFKEIASGEWGSADTRNLFAYAFNKKHHVVDVSIPAGAEFMKLDPSLPVYLIFDFNVDPMTCLVAQRSGIKWCRIIDEYRLRNSDIYDLCERILSDYGDYFLIATGDASGRNRNAVTKGKRSFVFILKELLKLSINQVQFPSRNPSVSDTRVLMNALFKKHGNIWISSKCMFFIDDLQTVTVDEKGEMEKEKDHLKTHLLDNGRYLFWNYFRSFLAK